MTVLTIPFGGEPCELEVPDRNLAEVLSPKPSEALPDLDAAIEAALDSPIGQPPLESWVRSGDRVVIVSGGDSYLGIEDNPVRRDMDDMAERVGMRTIFNAVMNDAGGVVGLFFGEMRPAFREGVRLAREIYGIEYHEVPDVVLANSFPCDLDFWQSHKSLYPAQRMVKPGGTIIVCTPAPEGVSPVHTELLDFTAWSSSTIKAAYRDGRLQNGVASALAIAWAMAREHASVINYSPGISPEEKAALGHTHAPDLAWAVDEALRRQGPDARLTVLTHAPEILPIGPVEV